VSEIRSEVIGSLLRPANLVEARQLHEHGESNGAEFKRFYSDPTYWKTWTWHEDAEILIDGKDLDEHDIPMTAINDSDIVEITGGIVFVEEGDKCGPSVESYFRKWKKEQRTAIMVIECPIGKASEVADAVRAAGGKVR
jgi:hypothetical protein